MGSGLESAHFSRPGPLGRDIPAYALTVARPGRLGRHLRETTTDCSRFDRRNEPADSPLAKACSNSGRRDAQKSQLRESGPIALFMERLANQGVLDRPLEDRTGLAPLLFRGRHPYLDQARRHRLVLPLLGGDDDARTGFEILHLHRR